MAIPGSSSPFTTFRASLAFACLWLCLVPGLNACEYRYWWPEEYDTLSYIEPSIVPEKIFKQDFLYFSEPYALRDEKGHALPDWSFQRDWSDSELQKEAMLDEWMGYFVKTGLKGVDRKTLVELLFGGDKDFYDWHLKDQREVKAQEQREAIQRLLEGNGLLRPGNPFDAFRPRKDILEYVVFNNALYSRIDPIVSGFQWSPSKQTYEDYQGDRVQELSADFGLALKRATDPSLDSFLRMKYAFQVIRMKVAMKDYRGAVGQYEKLVGPSTEYGMTRYRCLGYRAMAHLALGEREKAFGLYVDVFDQCPALWYKTQQSVHFSFKPDEINRFISRLPNAHKKTSAYFLWAISQGRDYSPENLEGMIRYGVQETQTEALLVRMVQWVEKDNMLTDRLRLIGEVPVTSETQEPPGVFRNEGEKRKRQLEFMLVKDHWPSDDELKGFKGSVPIPYESLIALCEKTASDPKVRQPALWDAVGGYLALLQGQTDRADKLLDLAEGLKTKNMALANQIHLWRTMWSIEKDRAQFGAAAQKRFIGDLKWARSLTQWGNNRGLYHSLWVLAGQKFVALRDIPRAALAFGAAQGEYGFSGRAYYGSEYNNTYHVANYLVDGVATDEELVRLQGLVAGKVGQPLDVVLKGRNDLQTGDLLLILAVRAMRRGDYHGADTLMAKIPEPYFIPDKERSEGAGCFYGGSRCVGYKEFSYRLNHEEIDPAEKPRKTDIRGYNRMMESLVDRIEAARKPGVLGLGRLLYRLASIYHSVPLNGWPEVKRANCAVTTHTYYPETNGSFPLGIPSAAEFMKGRYDAFEQSVPDFQALSAKTFQEVVDLKTDPELRAQSQIALTRVELDKTNDYDGQAKGLRRFKLLFQATVFYRKYITRCGTLMDIDKTKVDHP